MPSEIELTLGELARIALGHPSLGPSNIAVLHSLIELLLKKLDCRLEKVSLGCYESNCLQKILNSTTISPFGFHGDNLEIITEKLERLNALENRLEKIQNRLENHFKEIEECNKRGLGGAFEYQNWEHYAGACDDLCFACEPENRVACQLVKNTDFMKKMLRRISFPLIDRMFSFEYRVEILHEDFKKFMEKTSEQCMKMKLVERCIQEIEHLRHQVDDHHLQFLGAMEEVQDMFDAKLDKIHLPALKKYVRDRFDGIENTLTAIRAKKTCPKTGGLIMDGVKCLSCGNDRVCAEKNIITKGVMPEAYIRNKPRIVNKSCACIPPPLSGPQVSKFQINFKPSNNAKSSLQAVGNCRLIENEYVFKEGRNRTLYRTVHRENSEEFIKNNSK